MAAILRSAARRLGAGPVRRAAFSSAAAPAPASGREGAIAAAAAAAVAVAGSGLGLWLLPSSLADSTDASAGQISAAASAGAVDERHDRRRRFLLGDSYRTRVFFNYEKRIRLRSPPEKIFEYFASVRNPDGEMFMLPADLMRAVVPVFPPSESHVVREGRLRGERNPGELHCAPSKFFTLFDTNTDDLISFAEHIFFVTLLSIPESSFSAAFKMFDIDFSGMNERHGLQVMLEKIASNLKLLEVCSMDLNVFLVENLKALLEVECVCVTRLESHCSTASFQRQGDGQCGEAKHNRSNDGHLVVMVSSNNREEEDRRRPMTMARTRRSVRVATVVATTVYLLLLLSVTATTAAGAHLERGRDLLEEEGGSPVAMSKEEPPSGHLPYRIVEGLIDKATGKSARLDLEKQKDEAEKPLLNIP